MTTPLQFPRMENRQDELRRNVVSLADPMPPMREIYIDLPRNEWAELPPAFIAAQAMEAR